MAKVTTSNYTSTQTPEWRGDFSQGREHNLPGGAMVDASAFSAGSDGRKFIPAGTLLGRTYTERNANTGFGPADVSAETPDDEVYLLLSDVTDALLNTECQLYRHGSLVYENFLPDWGSASSLYKAKVQALYECAQGVA